MRILIYDETKQGLLEKLRAEGHQASFRNPQYFKSSEIESADAVFTENEAIAAAYEGKAVVNPTMEAEAVEAVAETTEAVERKTRRRNK